MENYFKTIIISVLGTGIIAAQWWMDNPEPGGGLPFTLENFIKYLIFLILIIWIIGKLED